MDEKFVVDYVKPELLEYGYFGAVAEGKSGGAGGQSGEGEDIPEVDPCYGVSGLN